MLLPSRSSLRGLDAGELEEYFHNDALHLKVDETMVKKDMEPYVRVSAGKIAQAH